MLYKQEHHLPTLSFSLSINKSQGQTYKRVGVFLKEDVFAHGQLYVAASRVSDANQIRFFVLNNHNGSSVQNIVYREVL